MKLFLVVYLSSVTFTNAAIWKGHYVRGHPIDENIPSTSNPVSDSIGEKEMAVGVPQKEETISPVINYPIGGSSAGEKEIAVEVPQKEETTSPVINFPIGGSSGELDNAVGVPQKEETTSPVNNYHEGDSSGEKDITSGSVVESRETDQTTLTNRPVTVSREEDNTDGVLETDQTISTNGNIISPEKDMTIEVLDTDQTTSSNSPKTVSSDKDIAIGVLENEQTTPINKTYGCYHKDVGYIDKGSQKVLTTVCAMLSCDENGQMHIIGCDSQPLGSFCEIEPGEKPYPDCCYKIKCPK